jgi:hypothetical protein
MIHLEKAAMGSKGARPTCSITWDFERQAHRSDMGLEGSRPVCSANLDTP